MTHGTITTQIFNKLDTELTAAGFKFGGGWACDYETDWGEPDYTTIAEALADLKIGQDMRVMYTDLRDRPMLIPDRMNWLGTLWVLLIPTEGEDMIADYSVASPAFEAAIDRVAWEIARKFFWNRR